ncbi:MAG TPA: anthranilate synthase component I [Planctomycetota bacterium]|jgi:anthranilate synthase component 1|nr:anthranilate synthase component I [Planctomycetota bacterium]OQC20368.1 MAG: Anthranilate synthase component 1 [Planctomycetes bacterium ADurb.Bin069]HNR98647.1 anthranilate synthase component I [Planctomycetota bacterium]HNU25027.1 anthranilate synthase component I [Planctomycetota bacterium]HOE28489.1 anthranilate synthase component I [Planctomycetota bacterium]
MIPVSRELLADTLTPVSAYLRIRGGARSAFLLESVEGGERVARWSFLGRDPYLVLRGRGRAVERVSSGGTELVRKDFFAALREETRRVTPVATGGLPPFSGGGVGFLAYDAVRLLEKIPDRHGGGDDSLGEFHFFGTVLAFDHVRHRIHVITNVFVDGETGTPERAYRDAQRRLDEAQELLTRETTAFPPLRRSGGAIEPAANFTPEGFCEAVAKGKEYIRGGDILQIVLSQRFRLPVTADPFTVYRALRARNPSPYLFFFETCDEDGDLAILGSSPETLVKVAQRRVHVRPIAGTRPRGASEEEDRRLEAELLADEKELAEHRMLVDLGRHDVGRVAKYGTVRCPEFMVVERYSHVMHIVSQVTGDLRDDCDALDALAAGFPAGTVTGAPKIRAMELIDALEPERRGPYAGAVGYLDFHGNLDTAIAIRTLVIRSGQAWVQAGAGIVADSVPEREYQETVHKARALFGAIAHAEEGLA